jgi:hypothetical protein
VATLEQSEVEARLQDYDSHKVTDELYDMGKTLMQECAERVHYLDSKSVTLAGYTGAIIGLMVSTFSLWSPILDKWAVLLVAAGSIAGLISAGLALLSTWPRKFLLPSDTDWLETDGFSDPDRLKRYYVSSMHISITSHEEINASKVSKVKAAQLCLAAMVFCLLVAMGDATYRVVMHPSQPFSVHVVSRAGFSCLR